MIELKECPFCGREVTDKSFYSVDGFPVGCTCMWDSHSGEEAMDKWNYRPTEIALEQKVEKLIEFVKLADSLSHTKNIWDDEIRRSEIEEEATRLLRELE